MSSARLSRGGSPRATSQGGGIKSPSEPDAHYPPVDEALILYLKERFAPKVNKHFIISDYDRQVGHQEVIEHLEAIFDLQSNQ